MAVNCDVFITYISGHIDGTNSPAEERRLQKHLKKCPRCRALLDAMEQVDLNLRQAQQEPPADLTARIMSQVRKEPRRSAQRKRFYITFTAAAVSTAALFAFALFGLPNLTDRHDELQVEKSAAFSRNVQVETYCAAGSSADSVLPYYATTDEGAVATEPTSELDQLGIACPPKCSTSEPFTADGTLEPTEEQSVQQATVTQPPQTEPTPEKPTETKPTVEATEPTEPSEKTVAPTESAEPTEQTEPPTETATPTESTEPTEPITTEKKDPPKRPPRGLHSATKPDAKGPTLFLWNASSSCLPEDAQMLSLEDLERTPGTFYSRLVSSLLPMEDNIYRNTIERNSLRVGSDQCSLRVYRVSCASLWQTLEDCAGTYELALYYPRELDEEGECHIILIRPEVPSFYAYDTK